MRERSFEVELRDTTTDDYWVYTTVYYEEGQVTHIMSENGVELRFENLSSFDRERVEKHLIFNLSADESESGSTLDLARQIKDLSDQIRKASNG